MNKVWVPIVIVMLLVPLVSSPQTTTASVAGTVRDRVTSRGIPGASILLTGIARDRVVNFTTKTDADGQFIVGNVPASNGYWLIVSHGNEHVRLVYNQGGLAGNPMPVAAGQQVRDLRIEMTPTGEISGKVVDPEGNPVSAVRVQLLSRRYLPAFAGLYVPQGAPAETNRQGEYRISGLPPGPYYLNYLRRNAGSLQDLLPTGGGIGSPPNTEWSIYPILYFPGTIDPNASQPIYLKAGEHKRNANVIVSKVRTHRVRGSIVDSRTGVSTRSAQLYLVNRGGEPQSEQPYRTVAISNGRFDLHSILPGRYDLVVLALDQKPALMGHLLLEVGAEDIDGLVLSLMPGMDLVARVSAEGASSEATDLSRVRVTLRPDPPAAIDTGVTPTRSGAFSLPPLTAIPVDGFLVFRGVRPWPYSVEVAHHFENAYVKAVRLGSVDILAKGLTVTSELTETLEILLASPAAGIQGQVLDAIERPAAGLRVVLVPDERARRDLYRDLWTDIDGRFEMRNLPPANYHLFAWEVADEKAWLDSDFLQMYEGKGVPVRLEEGGRIVLQLHSIPPWF